MKLYYEMILWNELFRRFTCLTGVFLDINATKHDSNVQFALNIDNSNIILAFKYHHDLDQININFIFNYIN